MFVFRLMFVSVLFHHTVNSEGMMLVFGDPKFQIIAASNNHVTFDARPHVHKFQKAEIRVTGSGQHSLWLLASYIPVSTHFPEFTVIMMLDDIQVAYFDSKVDRLMRVSTAGEHGAELNLGQQVVDVLQEMFSSMRKRLTLVKHRFNLTPEGSHVQQRLTSCEVLEDGEPVLIMFRDGSNGRDADSLLYNMTHFTYAGAEGWEFQWDAVKKTYVQMLYSNIFLPLCVRTLQQLLHQEKHLVKRRVKPQVRIITKQVVGGAQVTCLATDFYPRHINLSLLRDGRPVDEGKLSGGLVLPNGNGLYQMRKMLMVSEEELWRKHSYTCEVSHLSLDNRLEVTWRAESLRSHRVYVISAPVSLMLAAILLLLWMMRRRRRKEKFRGITIEMQEQAGENEQSNGLVS